ncbi:MAG: rhodanese-like domain-containing protein [Spirochaetales bacterium]|jgi:rhodanese-related sulfurtransferase
MKKLAMILISALVLVGSLHAQASASSSAATSAAAAKASPISPKAAKDLLASGKEFVLLDVRTLEEFVAGRIQGSVLLPYDQITAATAAKIIGAKDKIVVVYCRTGHRSGIAAATLVSLGYTKVLDMGGILSWPYATIAGEAKKP